MYFPSTRSALNYRLTDGRSVKVMMSRRREADDEYYLPELVVAAPADLPLLGALSIAAVHDQRSR